MGCALSSPVELIRVQRRGNEFYRCAVAEMQGWRVGHEDAHEIRCEGKSAALWVLDGHGGDGAALYGAPELVKEFTKDMADGNLVNDARLEEGFAAVDTRIRTYFASHPEKESGSTVVGAHIAKQNDGSYSMKLLNCGDSRGIVVRGPTEEEATAEPVSLRIPQHILDLEGDKDAVARGDTAPVLQWPLLAESVDHKPNHATERARIEAGGGHVSEEEPPRLDGNLAVSRGLGDFEYKSDPSKEPPTQKVSCVPDVYEMSGLQPGSIVVLCCDGVWDVMTGLMVGELVRDWLIKDPAADLGEIATDIVKTSLARSSRDNVTAMVARLSDGTDYGSAEPDEMKNHGKLKDLLSDSAADEEVRKQYLNFLRKSSFPPEVCECAVCHRWNVVMSQCPCKQVYYCRRECQKKGWKAHKPNCPTYATPSPASAGGKK